MQKLYQLLAPTSILTTVYLVKANATSAVALTLAKVFGIVANLGWH